ncbi:MAG: serine/threonine protein kinase [Woeseiaceae bacterium]|nr:serine/threonine protein kinase [Woeseiaceae bacterium]
MRPMTRKPAHAALDYADLTPDDFLAALERLGFACDGRFLALNSYENRVYQVGLDDGHSIVVKFYRPNRWTDEQILEEHTFTRELAEQEISVVAPQVIDGSSLKLMDQFRLAVYPCRGGRAPELDNLDMLEQLGRLIARIHLVGEQQPFEHRPEVDVESYAIEPRDYLLDNDFIPPELHDAYLGVTDLLLEGIDQCAARSGGFDVLRLHADFHPGNVLVNRDAFHIVDFDDCRSGPAVQDIWMFLSGDRSEQTPQLAAILDGYQQFRPFDATELHLIEALRSMRIIHYAGWLAKRWTDPAFKQAFPWFDSVRYWDEHILTLREQVSAMQEDPLEWRD